MPGMTTMPILQSAPPANSSSALNGTVAPANIADYPSASGSDPRTIDTANASSADSASGVEAGSAPDSFAEVLQRQMAQTSPFVIPLPDFRPIADPALPVQSDSGLITAVTTQPVSVETLLSDLSNFADRLPAHGSSAAPASTDLVSAADIEVLAAVAKVSQVFLHALPVDIPEAMDVLRPELSSPVVSATSDNDATEEIPPDGLAAVAPFIQVLQPNEGFKPGGIADDRRPASSAAGRLLLTPALAARSSATSALPTTVMPQSDTGMEAAPQPADGFLPDAAGESAEFAATQATLTEVASTQSHRSEAIAPATSFESMLAAAQVASQHRTSGAHAANSPSAPLPIDTPVGSRGWDGEVADKLVWMVGRQEQRAELVLNPPQLGRIEVSLSVSDGQTSALFVSANPAVRDALEAALPRLREILADAGISLGQTQVGADSGNNAGDSSTKNAENRDNSGRGLSNNDLAPGNEVLRQLDAPQWLKRGNGLVDIFA
ncbi:MAG: flagellar hook-length control protein FliK [Rhodocyclaceae bacterium]|nr:MAG: flagellar hook-length control protein FliK [Rhodocyclaceae bacterium]